LADVIILGAGMVGVGAALALQGRGKDVVIVDRGKPAGETSYGNAGIIQMEAVEPYAMPTDLGSIAEIALKITNDVEWRFGSVMSQTRALWDYYRLSHPKSHRRVARTWSQLIRRSTADHEGYIAASQSEALIRREGFYLAYRKQDSMKKGVAEAERLHRDYGVKSTVLDAAALMAAEPALKPGFLGAVHWTESWTCASPGMLTEAYALLFQERGGSILTGNAHTLCPDGSGWQVDTKDGLVSAPRVVICLGPWSPEFLARFGYKVPMIKKRGYHQHFTGGGLKLPIMDKANGAVLAPMKDGLRITTGAELTGVEAGQKLNQIRRAERGAREVLDLGDPVEPKPWHGARPCMPDMLPVVGEAPNHKGLWLNFGHGHQGFTLGPTTGNLLANAMDGQSDQVMEAVSPRRLV